MISCSFESGSKAALRHMTTHAIVEKDNAILLEKRSSVITEGDKWGLPGGFLDRDETLREGVLRELREETGWEGEIISLFRINSNPKRPHEDRQNIAVEFIIRPTRQISQPDRESTKVEWIPIDKLLPFEDFAFDHGETIRLYLEYRKNPHNLPIIY